MALHDHVDEDAGRGDLLEHAGGDPRPVGHAQDRDLGLAPVVGDAGDDDLEPAPTLDPGRQAADPRRQGQCGAEGEGDRPTAQSSAVAFWVVGPPGVPISSSRYRTGLSVVFRWLCHTPTASM